jgi:hypothetical protein
VYSVTGTAKTVQLTYTLPDYSVIISGPSEQLPFTYTWSTPPNPFQLILLTAGISTRGDTGTVLVSVTENGIVVASDTATGYPNAATVRYVHQ